MLIEIPDNSINHFVKDTLIKTIDLAKCAHYTDIDMRINGENKSFEADWIKYMKVIKMKGR